MRKELHGAESSPEAQGSTPCIETEAKLFVLCDSIWLQAFFSNEYPVEESANITSILENYPLNVRSEKLEQKLELNELLQMFVTKDDFSDDYQQDIFEKLLKLVMEITQGTDSTSPFKPYLHRIRACERNLTFFRILKNHQHYDTGVEFDDFFTRLTSLLTSLDLQFRDVTFNNAGELEFDERKRFLKMVKRTPNFWKLVKKQLNNLFCVSLKDLHDLLPKNSPTNKDQEVSTQASDGYESCSSLMVLSESEDEALEFENVIVESQLKEIPAVVQAPVISDVKLHNVPKEITNESQDSVEFPKTVVVLNSVKTMVDHEEAAQAVVKDTLDSVAEECQDSNSIHKETVDQSSTAVDLLTDSPVSSLPSVDCEYISAPSPRIKHPKRSTTPEKPAATMIGSISKRKIIKRPLSFSSTINDKGSPIASPKTKITRPAMFDDLDQDYGSFKTMHGPLRKGWTSIEMKSLKAGVERYGFGKWALIREDPRYSLAHRTNVQLKDKWRNMCKHDPELRSC